MKSLADEAILLAIALVVVVLAFQWAWHVIAALVPLLVLPAILYLGYRYLIGRRFF